MSHFRYALLCVISISAAAGRANAGRSADAPDGYSIVCESDAGKSLLTRKAGVNAVQPALEATLPELAAFFDNRPTVGTAYRDVKDEQRGGATFAAVWNHKPVHGVISCNVAQDGASIGVTFCRDDAAAGAFDKLLRPAAATDDSAALLTGGTVFTLADGSGSLTLPKGWTCKSTTAAGTVVVQGPDSQAIAINNPLQVVTPDSMQMQNFRQAQASMAAIAARTGARTLPPPMAPPICANFTNPEQAMIDLVPQLSRMNQANGGWAVRLDRIVSHQDNPPDANGRMTAVIVNEVTRYTNGQPAKFNNLVFASMSFVAPGTWLYLTTNFSAPVERFEQDKPVMLAIFQSFRMNNEQVGREIQQQTNQLLAQGEAAHQRLRASGEAYDHQQKEQYAAHNQQWKEDELNKQRRAADFRETIQGTRTIYDTVTGQRGEAELTSANEVVNAFNEAALDPNRFIQIPLRDQLYPR